MSLYTFLLGLVSAVLLAACDNSQMLRDEDSQFFSVPPGSTFTLNREITVQPDQTSVYLQHGKIERVGNIDFYKPHCKFELFTISEQARVVKPDTFVVTRIVDQNDDVATHRPLHASPVVASGDGPFILTYSTTMYLDSKIQPDVFRMDCKQWDDYALGEYLTINEMRTALGDHFSLELAE